MCFCEYRNRKIQLAERMANLTFSVISKSCDVTDWENILEEHGAAKGAECGSCGGVDKGKKETVAKSRELGMEADSGSTSLHTGGSTAGRDRSIISRGKRSEDKAKVNKLYGKHCKWAAGSYF